MKWFKHLTTSGHDPDIGSFLDEFGPLGYFLFFRTVEIMATEFDIENPGKNKFNFQWFLSQFPRKIGKKKIKNFLISAQKKKRIFYRINGTEITLNCPKLKDLTDEYTTKLLTQKSGLNRDKIRSESGKNPSHRIRSKNKNKNIINKCEETDLILTDLLINGILSNDSKAKVPEKETDLYFKWVNQARLMRESDKRPPEEIECLIRFSQEDEFWQSNILSMGKLREKATQLLLKAKRFKPDDIGRASPKEKPQKEKKFELARAKKEIELTTQAKLDGLVGEKLEMAVRGDLAKWSKEYWGET